MTFEESSGNVFAYVGFANSEGEQLKAHLTLQIDRIIKSRASHRLKRAQFSALSSLTFRL